MLEPRKLKRAFQIVCKLRKVTDDFPTSTVFAVFDGGKTGNTTSISSSFQTSGGQQLTKAYKAVHLVYDETGLNKRYEKYRATLAASQLETCHLFTNTLDQHIFKKRKNRKNFENSTTWGNTIQGVGIPPPSSLLCLPFKDKRECYGSDARIAVGGPTEGEPLDGSRDDVIEPFCFHSMAQQVHDEVISTDVDPRMVLDICSGDGLCAETCIKLKVPYVGICHTQKHAECLMHRLISLTLRSMRMEGSEVYNADLANLLAPALSSSSSGSGATGTAPLAKAKSKAKTRPKAAPAPPAASGEADASDPLIARIQQLSAGAAAGSEGNSG